LISLLKNISRFFLSECGYFYFILC